MRYSLTQHGQIFFFLTLINGNSAAALSSTVSSSSSVANGTFSNSTRYDTVTIASLASATTFTTDNYTFTVTPASDGEASPTTISEPNGGNAIFISSLLIIEIPPGAASSGPSTSNLSSGSNTNTIPTTSRSFTNSSTVGSSSVQSSALFSNSTTVSTVSQSSVRYNSSLSATSRSLSSTNPRSGTSLLPSSSGTASSLSSSSNSLAGSDLSTASTSQGSSRQFGSSITGSASPSSSASIPTSTGSLNSSTISTSSSSVNPLNVEPYISIVTTVVSGTTQFIPYMFGGMFTTPVPVPTTAPITSLIATGAIASSSASALSSRVNNDLIPLILLWTNTPQKSQADAAVQGIKGILPFAENLLDSLGGDPTPGESDCTGKRKRSHLGKRLPNPFKIAGDIIKDVSCVVNTLEKTSSEIEAGLKTAVDDVEDDISTLKNLTSDLEDEEDDDDDDDGSSSDRASKTASSAASSSLSCSKTITTEDYYVRCVPSTISLSSNQVSVTQVCSTSTSTVSGGECSVTAFTTTSTSSGTQSYATAIATIDDNYVMSTNLPPADTSLGLFYDNRLNDALNSNSTAPAWPGGDTQLTTFTGVTIVQSGSSASSASQTSSNNSTTASASRSVATGSVSSTFSTVIKSSTSVSVTKSTIITTSSQAAASSSSPTVTRCVGNQVENNCVAGGFPSLAPYSGVQEPSCANADGESGRLPRINDKAASDAATKYCAQLISAGTVLVADGVDANPAIVRGVAEGGAQMSLVILYDVDGCPTDKSMTTVDFKAMGQDECVMNMYTAVSTVCAQDSTWEDYNADFTLEGGTYMNACAIWTIVAGS